MDIHSKETKYTSHEKAAINGEFGRIWKKVVVFSEYYLYYLCSALDGLGKIKQKSSDNFPCPGQNSNQEPSAYKQKFYQQRQLLGSLNVYLVRSADVFSTCKCGENMLIVVFILPHWVVLAFRPVLEYLCDGWTSDGQGYCCGGQSLFPIDMKQAQNYKYVHCGRVFTGSSAEEAVSYLQKNSSDLIRP
jgi:hypothetical protein